MTKPRRRWLQFNLKSLLIRVFVVALPCAWLAWKLDLKRRERAAVAEIKRLGGWLAYDWEDPFREDEPPRPRWVRRLLGDDFFARVVAVDFGQTNNGDSVLLHLKELPDLELLFVGDGSVTGSGFISLTSLTSLKGLNLDHSGVTDANLVHLKRLTTLKRLSLNWTNVTDAAVVHLEKLQGLNELSVGHNGISDDGIIRLRKSLPHCEIIDSDGVDVEMRM